jgi:SAM-dependent methyltransferase
MRNQQAPKICPVCGQGERFEFIRDFERDKEKFSLYQCSECFIQFWLPFKNPQLDWYEKRTFRIKNIIKPGVYRGYHKFFLKTNKKFPKGTRVLDLGCGSGEFLAELEKKECEVWGVDFDKENVKIAKEYFNLKNVFALSFDDFFQNESLPKFDVITFFETIEYLDNPLKFIQNIKKLLKPGGKIILSVPSRERMLSNLNRWDFPPHHLTRWNKQTVSNLFKKYDLFIDRVDYVEPIKILSEAVSGKFKTGIVSKSLSNSKSRGNSLFSPKVLYFLGCSKDYIIGTIPAFFLWIIGKIFKINNGIMLIELK